MKRCSPTSHGILAGRSKNQGYFVKPGKGLGLGIAYEGTAD
jgi:hypothetical protein